MHSGASSNLEDIWILVCLTLLPYHCIADGIQAWENNGDSYCNIDNDPAVPCAQGLVPIFMAQVKNTSDVQAAVSFARDHNLSTRVKGAAHD